jgi:hypothetical protein
MLPSLFGGQRGARLAAHAAGTTIDGPQALLVSNDSYGMGDIAGLGRRPRLDAGARLFGALEPPGGRGGLGGDPPCRVMCARPRRRRIGAWGRG